MTLIIYYVWAAMAASVSAKQSFQRAAAKKSNTASSNFFKAPRKAQSLIFSFKKLLGVHEIAFSSNRSFRISYPAQTIQRFQLSCIRSWHDGIRMNSEDLSRMFPDEKLRMQCPFLKDVVSASRHRRRARLVSKWTTLP